MMVFVLESTEEASVRAKKEGETQETSNCKGSSQGGGEVIDEQMGERNGACGEKREERTAVVAGT